jgi:pimeloyl-ACP methyl ester carboxylesterase
MARFFADLFAERNSQADLQTIIHQFEAHAQRDAEDHQSRIACPTIILSGSEDGTHQGAFALKARIPGCEMQVLPGAGHACQIEQPWLFNRLMIEFLTRRGLFPKQD